MFFCRKEIGKKDICKMVINLTKGMLKTLCQMVIKAELIAETVIVLKEQCALIINDYYIFFVVLLFVVV